MKTINVNNHEYEVLELVGHGKGGYSYIVRRDGEVFIAKQLHHEPCSYYEFSNKLESELRDYERLQKLIPNNIPQIIEVDKEKEIIIKTFINGVTVDKLVLDERMIPGYYDQVEKLAKIVNEAGFNLDYFPTNFVVVDGKIYYIDFELNEYSEEWNYESWGKKYWYRTKDFMYFFHPSSTNLYTDRLILRKLQVEDYDMVFNNDVHIPDPTRFTPWESYEDKDQVKEYLEKVCREYDDSNTMRWAIVLQETQQLIGCIDVSHRDVNEVSHIGYVLNEEYIAKGYMSEALEVILKKTFERGINIVGIDAKEGDVTTNMVAMKNGFEFSDTTLEPNKDDPSSPIRVNHYVKRKI